MTEQAEKRDIVRVLIVDDEPLARDCIRLALDRATGVEIIAECADGATAVEEINATSPDLVFLDVQMPDLDGFGVIDRVGADRMPFVVFVTAFDAHALRAFEVHAIDYVLKPFDDRRIVGAVERVRERMREHQRSELARRLADVVQSWNGGSPERLEERVAHTPASAPVIPASREPAGAPSDDWDEDGDAQGEGRGFIGRFAVRGDGRVRFVMTTDVDWIEADRNYVFLHVGDVKHRLRASLRNVTARLDPKIFVRIHRSAVVNIHCIREVQPWFGGDYVAILRNGTKLKVSRLRAARLLKPMT